MIFVTHFTAVASFQFLHNRYIIKRKLHWYSEAFELHQRQRPTTKPTNGKQNAWAFGGATKMADKACKGAYHLAKKCGNFGLRSNGNAIFRKIFSEIVDNLQR